MNTSKLRSFAAEARNKLIQLVSAKIHATLRKDTPELIAKSQVIKKLEEEIAASSLEQVVEQAAYTWFNRFCALRFMDVNGYNSPMVLTPAEGFVDPEILTHVKAGQIPDLSLNVEQLKAWVDSQPEKAYRMLLVASCNALGQSMPFLFEQIEDWTELILPDDLLSEHSILALMRQGMTQEDSQQEEILGWLYQYYISEKKDQVFANLKKNKKISPDKIPAATQLFTPHWIVKYLVQNTLGQIWMTLKPSSNLVEEMEYYIHPSETLPLPEGIQSVQDITFVDPCTGSGHMLVYAFELLAKMYEEEGYSSHEIPSLILQHNLFGMEIDQRAAILAGFALCMKARSMDRRFLGRKVQPQICHYTKIHFETGEARSYLSKLGLNVSLNLTKALDLLAEVDNLGSLILPECADAATALQTLEQKGMPSDAFEQYTHLRLLIGLRQIVFLSRKYACVVTNPPYMGGKGMNDELSKFAKTKFPDSKSDLFAMFIERGFEYAPKHGLVGMVTMQSWMFLSSYEALRAKILDQRTIVSMAHLGPRGFDSIGGEVVQTTAFVINTAYLPGYQGGYVRLVDGGNEAEKQQMFLDALEGVH